MLFYGPKVIVFFLSFFLAQNSIGQNSFQPVLAINSFESFDQNPKDSINNADTSLEKVHSPRRATYYSMLLPGLGQAYNKQYWKIPVIYTAFGVSGYFIKKNYDLYQEFRKAYLYTVDEDSTTLITQEEFENYSILKGKNEPELRALKNDQKRNLELSYIITGFIYLLNVIDATVYAHLYDFNINEDLSMRVEPVLNPAPYRGVSESVGLKLSVFF